MFGVPHLPRPAEPWCKKKTSCLLGPNSDYKKIYEFLRVAGFCRIWIPNFSLPAKPFYEATKEG
jgi:hypothetical protein